MRSRGIVAILALVLVAGAGTGLWRARWEIWPKRFVEVEPGLFRSGQISPRLVRETLRRNGIDVVIDLQHPAKGGAARAEQEAVRELGLRYERFPLRGDGTGDPERYVQALAAIDRARRAGDSILVHCAAGARRTGGVVALYELLLEGRQDAAYRELARYGAPSGDRSRLLAFLNANVPRIAARLVELGVMDPLPALAPRLVSSPPR